MARLAPALLAKLPRCVALGALAMLALVLAPARAPAQFTMSFPSPSYFQAFSDYWDGDYRSALSDFQGETRGGLRAGTNRWIDSVCAFTMLGECYYQLGQHQAALQQYTSALQIYYTFNDWMIRVQFGPNPLRAAGPGSFKQIPWARSNRPLVLGQFPDTFPISQGQMVTQGQVVQGGPIQTPMMVPIHAQEIVRCTTLALRRRRELMGPACAQDQLTNDLIAVLARRPTHVNHWSQSWVELQLGVAYTCGGKDIQAKESLERAILADGQYDHPLTGMALLELGQLALKSADYDTAAGYFSEASISAGLYMDPSTVEEALRYGALTHLLANREGFFTPLGPAAVWAKANSLRHLNASAQVLAAENYCVMEQPQQAANLVASAASTIGRRGMAVGKLGARLNLVWALAAYQQGDLTTGDQKVAQAIAFQKNGSLRLFQIALIDSLYTGGTHSARVAMDLFSDVLRDSTPQDWATDPLESLSVMMVPHPLPYEHWFEVAVDRKDHDRVLEISDLARRHSFLSTLDMGGRLHNLRWLLEGPEEVLDQQSKLQRQDLLARYGTYGQLHQEATALRETLKRSSLAPADQTASQELTRKLARLAEISSQQETVLRQMAVRREPCALLFPPFRTTKEIKDALPPGHAILSFYSTARQAYAILLTHDKYGYWKVPATEQLVKPVMKVLHGLGSMEANREVTLKDLESAAWREPAKQIVDTLTKDSRADLKSFKQLVIVPDGVLWYLPFELLPVTDEGQQVPLATKVQIRYAPLASLGLADPRPRRVGGTTGVVLGKLMHGSDAVNSAAAYDEIAKALPETISLQAPLRQDPAPFVSLLDGLIVLNEVVTADADKELYDWSPLPADQRGASNVANWFALPWGGPDFIIMPSFHTAAEHSSKKQQAMAPGDEVFYSVCGLMANGARTILLSRWRTGGQTSIDLVREFVQELPHSSATDAWQRSQLLVAQNPLNVEAEPRLRLGANDEPPAADHPFFWAGYMLVDTGTLPPGHPDEKPAKAPAVAADPPKAGMKGPGGAAPVPAFGAALPAGPPGSGGNMIPPNAAPRGTSATGADRLPAAQPGMPADIAAMGDDEPAAQPPATPERGKPARKPARSTASRRNAAIDPSADNTVEPNQLFSEPNGNLPQNGGPNDGQMMTDDSFSEQGDAPPTRRTPRRTPAKSSSKNSKTNPKKNAAQTEVPPGGLIPAEPWGDEADPNVDKSGGKPAGKTPVRKPNSKSSNSKTRKPAKPAESQQFYDDSFNP